jgi:hypothetical protein
MKAITIHQPWASLIALGLKQYETRHWATSYRGKIAIHAGKVNHCKSPFQTIHLFGNLSKPVYEQLQPVILDGYKLPVGAVVAIADLTNCIKMTEKVICSVSELEQKVGHWDIDRFAWKLENIEVIDPVFCKGAQGLWEWNLAACPQSA